jgi:protein gp37
MNKTKIEWANYSWNPIRGLCPEGCWYCYARAMYRRFKLDERLEFHVTRGDIARMDRVKPSRIFVCSTMEIFNPQIKAEWHDKIFQTFDMFPKHTFIVLTKHPELITKSMPDNVWLGVSVTGAEDWYRVRELSRCKARIKFVSLEPFLGSTPSLCGVREIDWLIIGRLTGHGEKHDPEPAALQWAVCQTRGIGVPVFLKNNLAGIWPGPLIQEYPCREE